MLTLHKDVQVTRSLVKWGLILLAGFFILNILIRTGKLIKEFFYPTMPPAPTVSFGKLPKIIFPESITNEKLVYTIETITGSLNTFPDRANVYQVAYEPANLLNADRAREKVRRIGFIDENRQLLPETIISPSIYAWQETTNLKRKITFDLKSFNFDLVSDFASDPYVQSAYRLPTESEAIVAVQKFLETMEISPPDIAIEKTTTSLYTLQHGSLIPATSFSKAHVVRVNFFQNGKNDLPIYYPYPPFSLMDFYLTGGSIATQVAKATYIHRTILDSDATYPIKTASTALEELKAGKGYIASYHGATAKVTIRSASLGLYISDEKQGYVMPIIVFEGDGNFVAYTSAVTDDWIE